MDLLNKVKLHLLVETVDDNFNPTAVKAETGKQHVSNVLSDMEAVQNLKPTALILN